MKTLIKSKTVNDYRHRFVVAKGGCWEWMKSRNALGYGIQTTGSRTDGSRKCELAHRLFYRLQYGSFDQSLCVLHKCDNPPCVNPEHLYLGTINDNVQDMIKKGRKVILRGEAHPIAKLNEKQVLEIRERLSRGEFIRALAREYGVNRTAIKYIKIRRTWVHI